jgi:hypothetical protein
MTSRTDTAYNFSFDPCVVESTRLILPRGEHHGYDEPDECILSPDTNETLERKRRGM